MTLSILLSGFTGATLFVGAAMTLTAQTPVPPPVSKGVPREIALSRTDNELNSLVAAGMRIYTIYSFQAGDRLDHATMRRWRGLLLTPRAAELGRVVNAWYTHSDGTRSKLVLNEGGRALGVMSMRGTRMWASLDLNGDGLADFFRSVSRNGDEMIAVMEGEGAAFFRHWRDGQNPLCAVAAPRSLDRSGKAGLSPVAKPGAMPMCGEAASDAGSFAFTRRDRLTSPPSPMERICAGSASLPSLAGAGPRTDPPAGGETGGVATGSAGTMTTGSTAVEAASVAGMPSDNNEMEARKIETMLLLAAEAERIYSLLLKPPTTAKDIEEWRRSHSSPSADADANRAAGAGGQSLAQVCSARARAERRWNVIEIAEKQSGGADTNCDDPISDPAAAEGESRAPKCGPNTRRESLSDQLLDGIGAYESRRCTRYENPGPDGTCRGGRTLPGKTGQLWYGFGSLIGLVPCDGIACDPKNESR